MLVGLLVTALAASLAAVVAADGDLLPSPVPAAQEEVTSPTGPPARTADCPRLESGLLALTQAGDPAAYAAGSGLEYQDGVVSVEIVLTGSGALPAGPGVVVEAQYGPLVQARVPLRDLCALSNDAAVASIRSPVHGMPNLGTAIP